MMISLSEAKARWEETFKHGSSTTDLQRAVKSNGPGNPCATGLRSVCWKAFLLFPTSPAEQWSHLVRELRASYKAICDQHLRFIRHPEQLAALPIDPLADDADSPWIAVRKDDLVRAEILQDVSRLPDEPFYHEERIQTMILDILFLYCKLNPSLGGYRQGMHELLAPIIFVVAQDAVDRAALTADDPADVVIAEMLDSSFVEHDAFALFSKLMERASTFYEVDNSPGAEAQQKNIIVERSKYIHEVALMAIDEELAIHLRNIEVLPQIFLIRWIRLLFGREFSFDQLLVLWDTIFACDPSLELIDLICVAMLLRIRWTLLEADYSVALQLMLKYPIPSPPHGPHTFVDDAIFLKRHFDAAGGAALIFKYTGKSPAKTLTSTPASTQAPTPAPSSTSTPPFNKFSTLRQRTLGARSPLSASARILRQPGGVEALLQGAAKNVMERGEKLGINQAVRDAMGEIRRNVQQGLQEARSPTAPGRSLAIDDGPSSLEHVLAMTLMEQRNRRLAAMLDESVMSLKLLVASGLGGEKAEHLETIEITTAKVQLVKACLEDPSLDLPEEELPTITTLTISSPTDPRSPTVALDTTPVVMTSSAVEETRTALSSPASGKEHSPPIPPPPKKNPQPNHTTPDPNKMDMDMAMDIDTDPPAHNHDHDHDHDGDTLPPLKSDLPSPPPLLKSSSKPPTPKIQRPAPIPTRSTLAQSSFSWMLEPDTTLSSSSSAFPSSPSSRPPSAGNSGGSGGSGGGSGGGGSSAQKKRHNPSRERNAFLFGEVTAEGAAADERGVLKADQIFGLEVIRRG